MKDSALFNERDRETSHLIGSTQVPRVCFYLNLEWRTLSPASEMARHKFHPLSLNAMCDYTSPKLTADVHIAVSWDHEWRCTSSLHRPFSFVRDSDENG